MTVALAVTAPGRLELRDVPSVTPGRGDVTVRVAWAGVCHTDLFILAGRHPAVTGFPHTPGHEFSGVVSAVGEGVPDTWAGKRVTVITQIGCGHCRACFRGDPGMCSEQRELGSSRPGGWQEELQVPAASLVEIPEGMTLRDASLIEPSANALSATRRACILPGDTVVIIGPGAIGQLAIGHARREGAGRIVVVGRVSNSARIELARSRGADATVQVGSDEGEASRAIVDALGGRPDVILQCAGSVSATRVALGAIGIGGRLVIEGFAEDDETISVGPDRLVAGNTSIAGVRGWTIGDFTDAIQLEAAESGPARLAEVPIAEFGLADFEAAIEMMHDTSRREVKVAFRPGGDHAEKGTQQ